MLQYITYDYFTLIDSLFFLYYLMIFLENKVTIFVLFIDLDRIMNYEKAAWLKIEIENFLKSIYNYNNN